jgi:hypothetical protein
MLRPLKRDMDPYMRLSNVLDEDLSDLELFVLENISKTQCVPQ